MSVKFHQPDVSSFTSCSHATKIHIDHHPFFSFPNTASPRLIFEAALYFALLLWSQETASGQVKRDGSLMGPAKVFLCSGSHPLPFCFILPWGGVGCLGTWVWALQPGLIGDPDAWIPGLKVSSGCSPLRSGFSVTHSNSDSLEMNSPPASGSSMFPGKPLIAWPAAPLVSPLGGGGGGGAVLSLLGPLRPPCREVREVSWVTSLKNLRGCGRYTSSVSLLSHWRDWDRSWHAQQSSDGGVSHPQALLPWRRFWVLLGWGASPEPGMLLNIPRPQDPEGQWRPAFSQGPHLGLVWLWDGGERVSVDSGTHTVTGQLEVALLRLRIFFVCLFLFFFSIFLIFY